jgi:hypothetical protein
MASNRVEDLQVYQAVAAADAGFCTTRRQPSIDPEPGPDALVVGAQSSHLQEGSGQSIDRHYTIAIAEAAAKR